MATPIEIVEVLSVLAACYPRFELTKATTAAYIGMLDDLPAPALQAAAKDLARRSKWFPSVSELSETALDIMLNRAEWPTAGEAWELVGKHMREVHAGSRRKEHALVEKAVAAVGGWYTLRHSDDHTADRARFMDTYKEIVEKERRLATEHPMVRATREQYRLEERKLLE